MKEFDEQFLDFVTESSDFIQSSAIENFNGSPYDYLIAADKKSVWNSFVNYKVYKTSILNKYTGKLVLWLQPKPEDGAILFFIKISDDAYVTYLIRFIDKKLAFTTSFYYRNNKGFNDAIQETIANKTFEIREEDVAPKMGFNA